jgi:hypothetical protein
VITSLIGTVATEIGADDPAALEDLVQGGTPLAPAEGSPLDQILDSQFGSCNFNALPTAPGGGGLPPLPGVPGLPVDPGAVIP